MGIWGKTITLGLTGVSCLPEVGKLKKAATQGKLGKQLLGSVLNIGKWAAVAAVIGLANPVTVIPCLLAGVSAFALPGFIKDIDVTKDSAQESGLVA